MFVSYCPKRRFQDQRLLRRLRLTMSIDTVSCVYSALSEVNGASSLGIL